MSEKFVLCKVSLAEKQLPNGICCVKCIRNVALEDYYIDHALNSDVSEVLCVNCGRQMVQGLKLPDYIGRPAAP